MKYTPKIVQVLLPSFAVVVLMTCGGCAGVERSPSLTEPPEQASKPAAPGPLERMADTTWNVVSAPVRWVAPGKKPPEPPPENNGPADMIIMTRDGQPWQPAAPAPAPVAGPTTPVPAPVAGPSAPATQPR